MKLISLLNKRVESLKETEGKVSLYALRQLLSLSREEIGISTGLKVSQIQQLEENRISVQFASKISSIFSVFMKERLSSIILQTIQNIQFLNSLLSLELVWERINSINEQDNPYPYLVDLEVENHNFIAGNIVVHNSGLIPYLYKMGFRGPVYMTEPTRDIAALLALDFVDVAYKQAASPLYKAEDIKEMVRHSVVLEYGEVTDIAPDIRITLYNAGHVLGAAQVHINIGNGLHNLVYGGDTKYAKTHLLDPAVNHFPRIETLILESTYGLKNDILPPRQETEKKFIELAKATIEKNGKILLPELGLGHAQETVLRVEEAVRTGELPKVPVYIDGMVWDINAIHTAYPDFLSSSVKNQIFQDNNPFISDILKRVGSPAERKEVIEGGPCIIIATSGMLVGGASVEYFRALADSPNNLIIFGCYQAIGSVGRQVQDGSKEIVIESWEKINVKMQVETLKGLSSHSGRNELLQYVSRMAPKPKKIIINHGEVSKCLDLASTLYKQFHVETAVPKNLETIRLK
jgi:predicted metal-dependent RNase